MPNSSLTFKHRGKTYGLETIFCKADARDDVYVAFGKESSFLTKLMKLGFVASGSVMYHPTQWEPIKAGKDSFYSHKHATKSGDVRLGRLQVIKR